MEQQYQQTSSVNPPLPPPAPLSPSTSAKKSLNNFAQDFPSLLSEACDGYWIIHNHNFQIPIDKKRWYKFRP
ncbi:hypothetical protein O6P43_029026 [Quillaja saponaria]|uniref:Uncharacterized protein n=1 Tax=Quillaja saponaria TaxID=32244 RepID=A0AAD7L0I8_QUISA|nr:hypothetical protein O6P43_029026 [Quillaja saponaria]